MRFILALIPPKETVAAFIQAAQMLFASDNDGYLLSETSLPHVTVCQFECDSEQEARAIWQRVDSLNIQPIPLRFTGVSFVKGTGLHKEAYWTELSIARNENVMRIHRIASEIVRAQGFHSLNDSGDLYRPHLTLARIRLPDVISRWPEELLKSAGHFKLALARGDQNGQYLQTLCEVNPS